MRYKKILGLFVIIFGIVLFLFGVNGVNAAEWINPINAVVSSTYPCYNPACNKELAYDGNVLTGWTSSQFINYPNEWIYFDLGENKDVSGIKLYMPASMVGGSTILYNLDIEVSSDSTNWVDVNNNWGPYSVVNDYDVINFDVTNARYIKVQYNSVTQLGTSIFTRLFETKVLVDSGVTTTGSGCTGESTYDRATNVRCSSVWKSDSYYRCSRITEYLYNPPGRYWVSGDNNNEWVYQDLGEKKCINNVKLYDAYSLIPNAVLDIQVSDTGNNDDWHTVYEDLVLSKQSEVESPDLNSQGRYVRLLLDSGYFSLSRFEINSQSNILENTFCYGDDGTQGTPDDLECGDDGNGGSCGECDDSLFCNGVETCDSNTNTCQIGTPIICADDGKTCTTNEVCDEDSDSCINDFDHTVCYDGDSCTNDNCNPLSSNPDPITGCSNSLIPNCATVDGALWADMKDNTISITNIRDRVKLVVTGSNFLGKNVQYQIKKDVWWIFDTIVLSESSSKGFITWKSGEVSENNFESGNYIFKASVEGIGSVESEILVVLNSIENTAPVAQITSPDTGEIYLIGSDVEFRQDSYDVDDFFDYSWDIDEEIREGSSRDFVNYEFDHSYGVSGQKKISLSVVDERSLSDTDFENILIIDPNVLGKFVFSGIKSPVSNSEVLNPVEMDGSDSYAIKVSFESIITCIAGNCPDHVNSANGDIEIIEGEVEDLTYNWRFDSGNSGEVTVIDFTKYVKTFATLGWHDAELKISLESGEESSSDTRFRISNLLLDESGCLQDTKTQYRVVEGSVITMFDTRQPNDKCKGDDDIALTGDDCCPTGYSCESDGTGFKCQASTLDISRCEDYTVYGIGVCESDPFDIGSRGLGGESCGKYIDNICGASSSGVKPENSCNCYWTSGDECKQKGEIDIQINNFNIGSVTCELQDSLVGDCIGGVMTISETNNLNWYDIDLLKARNQINIVEGLSLNDDSATTAWLENNCIFTDVCISETRNILCGSVINKIDFFNHWNFIISFLIIGFIYLLINIFIKKQRIIN